MSVFGGIGEDTVKTAIAGEAAIIGNAVAVIESVASAATLNAADAVSDVVGAVDRLNNTLQEQSAAWLTAVNRLSDQIDRVLNKGISLSLKVNE